MTIGSELPIYDYPLLFDIQGDGAGQLVVALQATGFDVHDINPRAVARCRERHAQAGGKYEPSCSPTACALTGTSSDRCLDRASGRQQ